MAYIPDQQKNTGSFVPTTVILDVAQLHEVDVNTPEFKELLVRLYQTVNNISIALNSKDSAYYIQEEFVTSQLWFNPSSSNQLDLRAGFRKTINIGPIAAGATATIAHGLTVTSTWKWTFINGAATDTVNLLGYSISYADMAGNTLSARTTSTNVIVENNTSVDFTDVYVTLELVKN